MVDEGQNKICFVTDGEYYDDVEFSFSKEEFSVLHINALSLTDVIHKTIATDYALDIDMEQLRLTVSYITAGSECRDDVRATYVDALKGLATYSTIPFENFFWTSKETRIHFEGPWDRTNDLIKEDATTHATWMKLFDVINNVNRDDDICRFRDIIDQTVMPDGEVSFHSIPYLYFHTIVRLNSSCVHKTISVDQVSCTADANFIKQHRHQQ